MKQFLFILAETSLLLSALFFTLPYVPSHDVEHLPLFPAVAFAVAAFAGSRLIRWRPNLLTPLVETAGFALFAWGSNLAANLIYSVRV